MKIGILGGSFDPIHKGHIHMAVSAYEEYNLDEVWLIPAGHSPNKDENQMTSAIHRFEMCKLAAMDYPYLIASDYEIRCAERSYTYRTLERLAMDYPEHEFYFIMGADSLNYFEKWVHPEVIASLCTILVVIRDVFSIDDIKRKIEMINAMFSCKIEVVKCDRYDISSTQIRKELKEECYNQKDLSDQVIEYIKQNGLYKG